MAASLVPRGAVGASRSSSVAPAWAHPTCNLQLVVRRRSSGPAPGVTARSSLSASLSKQPCVLVRCAGPSATSVQEAPTAVRLGPGAVHAVCATDIPGLLEGAGASTLVVIDVYTAWCGPCKMIAPEVEKLAAGDFKDTVVFAKIDCTSVNENKKWAMAQNVKALPTFILFKGGQRVGDMTGAKVAALRKLIETHA